MSPGFDRLLREPLPGVAPTSVRAEPVTVVHSSRVEGEAIALCVRASSRAGAEPHVRVGRGGGAWRPAAGTVVVLDHEAEASSLLPAAVATLVRQESRVVLLVRELTDPVAEAARHAGASAVLSARGPVEAIVVAVDSCLLGARPRPSPLGAAGALPTGPATPRLTVRELAVLEMLLSAEEPSAAEVASRLGISVNTVKVHVANVRRRLGRLEGRNRVSLRGALEERGWLEVR
ncbi:MULTISPECIES: LuxR C-terminal-related transcriptional regulator [unclassified Rathayibacter]|uniref:LuxR C-terminal-related transcriptional regulator n=1 Tax=unclassified Rathayibacter TaxID=2609250 RepID=UPI00188D1E89|nr:MULTISPECIES: LuxR C-terminal-related transcriptional regulator [unclassified Rathayibacter]MBF4461251.1 response regulator transcription factor [Rathayibacter sp. VKM Ac-2879]MBF4502662.1 response regulator transcription factor [Rathayibacter sp. VKM Ac-2878]